jgi:DNA-binding response OmpR family regulator
MRSRILIVDDDTKICSLLSDILKEHNDFSVKLAHTTEEAWEEIAAESPDLVLLDVEVPLKGGLEFCREMKQKELTQNIPVIFLTVRDQEIDKVSALNLGGDDFITKPFRPKELVARIRVVLRRYSALKSTQIVQQGDLLIDFDKRMLRIRDKDVHLTPKEFNLLEFLYKNRHRVVSDKMIFDALWGSGSGSLIATVYTHMDRLRKKLNVYNSLVKTVSGVGYRFDGRAKERRGK